MVNSINTPLPALNAQSLQAQKDASAVQGNVFEAAKANQQTSAELPQPIATDVDHTDADPDGGGNNGAPGGGQGNKSAKTDDGAPRPTGLANNAPRVENSKAFFLAHPGASPLTRATHFVAFSTTAPLLPVTSRYINNNGAATKFSLGYRPHDMLRSYDRQASTPEFKAATKDYYDTAHACSPQRALLTMINGSSTTEASPYTSMPSKAAMQELNTPDTIKSLLQSAKTMQAGGQVTPLRTFAQPAFQAKSYPSYLPPLPNTAPPGQATALQSPVAQIAGQAPAAQTGVLSRFTAGVLPTFVRPAANRAPVPSLGGLRSFFSPKAQKMAA